MKREIKFRGKCTVSGDWIIGDLIHGVGHKKGNLYILPYEVNLARVKHCCPLDGVRVIPETVGQYTGLKDKSSKEINEDDIISMRSYNYHYLDSHLFKVIYDTEDMQFKLLDLHSKRLEERVGFYDLQIIGNIHDNPELLPCQ